MNTPSKTPATIVQVIRSGTPTLTYIHKHTHPPPPPPPTHTLLPEVPDNINSLSNPIKVNCMWSTHQ